MGGARAERRPRRARRDRVGDRSPALPGTWPHARRADRARGSRALGHHRCRARSDPESAGAGAHRARRQCAAGVRDRRREHPRCGVGIGREVRGLGVGIAHVRVGGHPDADAVAPSRDRDRRGAVVRTARVLGAMDGWHAARVARDAGRQCARAGRPVGAWHLGRPAGPVGADRLGHRCHARASGAARAGVLAAQGSERRRRHPERARGRLHRRDAYAVAGHPRAGPVGRVAATCGWRVPAARRWHGDRRSCAVVVGGACGPERRSWPALGSARASLPGAALAGVIARRGHGIERAPRGSRNPGRGAGANPPQRPRWLHAGRARVRHRSEW